MNKRTFGLFFVLVLVSSGRTASPVVSTFSIVACDSVTGELGAAVASRFFAVGSVVPWAKADVGAVATQAFANTSFGWRGLDLLESGATPDEALTILLRDDDDPHRRQVGIVSADGMSRTYTGKDCLPWAGGRCGRNYAVQGNILAGEDVVVEMERAFLNTGGSLGERLYAALAAGDSLGGDSRGRQSAALMVVRREGGYGGFSDRAIDVRVDDHPEPFQELRRLLHIALMNDAWNQGWTLFMQQKPVKALVHMERAAELAPENAEMFYDLAVIRLAAGKRTEALQALEKAVQLNPKLKSQAGSDSDLAGLAGDEQFQRMVK